MDQIADLSARAEKTIREGIIRGDFEFGEKLSDRTLAATLGISVYGGDAIISPDGTITLIDLNDWPSFAPCRGAAAFAIARFLKESYVTRNRRETASL